MAKVELRDVSKRFGKVVAVDKLSFVVDHGEFFCLLGPSGCGKTTTLRIIAGLEDPDEGEVLIDGVVVNDVPPRDRDVAMVFQNYALYPHMTVYQNLAFPLEMRGYPRNEIDKVVREVAKLLRIDDVLDRKPGQLSGGQQQRVALGRALVRRPKVFLMDEPLSNLDAKLRVYMRAELKRLQKELKITTIYVTHDQVEAMTMADRVAVMNRGRIMQIGTPRELYHKPANLFVAGFIGSPPMNFFDATLVEVDDGYVLDAGEFKLKIPKWMGDLVKREASSPELTIGVRPEHVEVRTERVEEGIKATVYVIEPLGGETIVDFTIGGKLYKARVLGELALRPGDTVYVRFSPDNVHVFDRKTGKAVV